MPAKGTLYTYAENFRAYKALIAAKYSGAVVKVDENFKFGETNKSKAFLAKFPFGKVPAFEDDSGLCLFESNAIAYHLANEELRGTDPVHRALIQQWISFADTEVLPSACTWVFSNLGVLKSGNVEQAKDDLTAALKTLNEFLLHSTFLVGERLTLADICLCCTLLMPYKFVLDPAQRKSVSNVTRWFMTMINQPSVKAVLGEVTLCEKAEAGSGDKADKKAPKKEKKEEKKEEKPADEPLKVEKPKDPMGALPKGNWDMDDFKRFYSNNDEDKSIPYFWEKFDKDNYSIWRCDYKYNDELAMVFMSCNLIGGMYQRLEKLRKNAFASMALFGKDNDSTISGIWVWRGHDLAFELSEDWQIDYSSYDWKKLDPNSEETKKQVNDYFKWVGNDAKGRAFNQGKIFK